MDNWKISRVKDEAGRAGAYYVRIQAMAKAYHITLPEEIDEHDGPDCHYILILDNDFPVATCRFFEVAPKTAEIGRVVVLPSYRDNHLGQLAVSEAEAWAAEIGFEKIVISSRNGFETFYEKLGYHYNSEGNAHQYTFSCTYMEKQLTPPHQGASPDGRDRSIQ